MGYKKRREKEKMKKEVIVEPGSAEIKADEEQKFTVMVKIPEDATIGHYSAQIVFTNDTRPTPYPELLPSYVNALDLSIQVWESPKILIQPQYIHDRVEAGRRQEYEIQLENKGDHAIAITPEFKRENRAYIDQYGPKELTEDWLTIDAPEQVMAHSKAAVTVAVNVPMDAKGMYEGSINLNIDDSSIERWSREVHIHREVWKQPETPFRENFSVKAGDKIRIKISTNQYVGYPLPQPPGNYGPEHKEEEKPSFDGALRQATPGGVKLTPEPSKAVKNGHISLGMGYLPPGASSSEEMYHVMSTEYSETYEITNATGGVWTLEILPKNTEGFEYTMEIGQ